MKWKGTGELHNWNCSRTPFVLRLSDGEVWADFMASGPEITHSILMMDYILWDLSCYHLNGHFIWEALTFVIQAFFMGCCVVPPRLCETVVSVKAFFLPSLSPPVVHWKSHSSDIRHDSKHGCALKTWEAFFFPGGWGMFPRLQINANQTQPPLVCQRWRCILSHSSL